MLLLLLVLSPLAYSPNTVRSTTKTRLRCVVLLAGQALTKPMVLPVAIAVCSLVLFLPAGHHNVRLSLWAMVVAAVVFSFLKPQ